MRYKPQALIWVLLARHVAAFNVVKNASDAFNSALQACPAACNGTPGNWTVYTSLQRLELRTCTAGDAKDARNGLLLGSKTKPHKRGIKYMFKKNTCTTATESKVDFNLAVRGDQGQAGANNLQAAIYNLQNYMLEAVHCSTKFLIGYSQGVVVAVYSGSAIDNGQTIPSVLQHIEKKFHGESPSSAIIELCGEDRNADYTFGVAIDTTGDIAAVQKAVVSWSNGTCFSGNSSSKLSAVSIFEAPLIPVVQNFTTSGKSVRGLETRGDCTTVTVISGDSCGSLASKCGIFAQSLSQFNPSPTFCSTLQPGQSICCTTGTLPDLTPQPNADGSCATYNVQSSDSCSEIAAANSLTAAQLEAFNDGTTWGWNGCNDLAAGINICLSIGSPPLPASIPNALCGPVVPGSAAPTAGQSVASLNPCPLNSCCDIWGQCGITPEFCTASVGSTGNPGTAPPGANGCISNCGTNITNNGAGPSSFMKVTYYETFNWDRPCLHYNAADLGSTDYTHAHWGFASVDSSFNIVINDTFNQLPDFLSLPQKKIVSFGGWGFSTDPTTFEILRNAMNPDNVNTFVDYIAAYIQNDWDGIDIDWEYPGAPDIPGIPPGLPSDGPNYLDFLTKLRSALGSSKTISIAAPASYWYLQAFPIADMAEQVDYIVYMTYDLHGQWDYGNQFSQDGCLAGDCLRSHVNLTETTYALAMITKAGVPSNKINVGVSSYGRSFGLTDIAACESSLSNAACTFVGPDSGATPGECTVTPGYISNAEIDELLNSGSSQYVFDGPSDSDTMFYGNSWVAWMSDLTKSTRISLYMSLNMGGTADWAVDLQQFTDDDANPNGSGSGGVIHYPSSIWQDGTPSVTLTTSVLVSQPGTTSTLPTTFTLPPFTISSVPFWPITIQSGALQTTFTPLQSIMPPSTVISLPSGTIIAPPRSGTYQAIPTFATPTTAPGPQPSDTAQDCSQWYQDVSGDTCASIAQKFGISQNNFIQLNPSLASSCGLVVGDWYCKLVLSPHQLS
ncbi:glycoside hydrolase family 18 [Trichoderma arundinaceum]|uniref:chitinase n=1 Tax=Trichoderma arundinaceum TaxID=490622 RepID=A0A395NIB9_TRIAR|nr:glycoside hydrolase family 18 [Trichoderma arundinaceum]